MTPAAGAPAPRGQRRGLPLLQPRSAGQGRAGVGLYKRPGGRRRAGFKQREGLPGGRAGPGAPPCPPPPSPAPSLRSAGQCQRTTCHFQAARPRRGGGGPGAAVPASAGRRASSGRARVAFCGRRTRSPPSPAGPHAPHPHPAARPGQAGHTWAGDRALGGQGPELGPRGQGVGAAVQGGRSRPGWRRMRGEGVGGPGRARTWRLYLQSPSVRAAEPHAAAQT